MAITYNKYTSFVGNLIDGVFNLGADVCKVSLSNTAPTAADTYATMIGAEIAAGNGYTAGGGAVASPSTTTTATAIFSGNNVTFTATGAIGPFRYARLYDSTASAVIAWFDYGSAVTMASGDTFTIAWNGGASSGSIFTIT